MQDQNILIDQLEDQLIDHPDASTRKQLKESSYDETFQKKLNERANQLLTGNKWRSTGEDTGAYLQFLVTKPILDFHYSDLAPLSQELSEWFSSSDYKIIDLIALRSNGAVEPEMLGDFDLTKTSRLLDRLTYFVLGCYGSTASEQEQMVNISSNCSRVISGGFHRGAVNLLKKSFRQCRIAMETGSSSLLGGSFASNYLKLLTVVYFLTNVALTSKTSSDFVSCVEENDLLIASIEFIDKWNQYPSLVSRIRNVLLITWKLILLEFGDLSHLQQVDKYVAKRHNIKNKNRKDMSNNQLTCSPLDYFTFRENLMDKYPLYAENVQKDEDNGSDSLSSSTLDRQSSFMAVSTYSNSLSNLLEMPRTNKSHTILGQLPIQTVHIATPVPSPPSTPSDFMTGGEKIRKLYHVNQGVPFVYPIEAKCEVPEAILEASKLLENAVYESYSIKRLWEERKRFMAQERGNVDQYKDKNDPADLEQHILDTEDPQHQAEIQTLRRIEKFYDASLIHLHGLVEVLLGVMKSNKFDFNLRNAEKEFDPETAFSSRFGGTEDLNNRVQLAILHQLELMQLKEIALKASSAILNLLIKWFKVSHVIKYQYFSSLLFDQQYFTVFVDFLGCSFNNTELQDSEEFEKGTAPYDILTSQNKLMNPAIRIPQFEFFNNCQGTIPPIGPIELINKTPIGMLPSTLDENSQKIVHITKYNENFCFILANLLNVTNKIMIKNISQRIFLFNETKSTDLLKVVLLNYINDEFRLPILKIFKKLVPYQGRKWRAINMDVVSLIYLHLKLSLKDDWLSGKDLECDFNNSFDQEIALRSLLQFYNIRKYPTQMLSLGYSLAVENIPQVEYDEALYS